MMVPRTESNRGPIDYKSIALPAELQGLMFLKGFFSLISQLNQSIKIQRNRLSLAIVEKNITICVRYKNSSTIIDLANNLKKFKNSKKLIIKKINGRKSYIVNFEHIFSYLLKIKPKFDTSIHHQSYSNVLK